MLVYVDMLGFAALTGPALPNIKDGRMSISSRRLYLDLPAASHLSMFIPNESQSAELLVDHRGLSYTLLAAFD